MTSGRSFIETGGVCDWRGDTSLRYLHNGVPDSPDDQTGLYNFTNIVPGSRLSNQFENASVCLAFTVSYVGSDYQRSTLMYSEDGAMFTLGSTIVLSIAGRNVSFDTSFIRAPPMRAQICLDESNAHLFIDCS